MQSQKKTRRPAGTPYTGPPGKQGLYDPANEKESCGVGFVAHIKGQRSHQIVLDAYEVLLRWTTGVPAAANRTPVTGRVS